MEMKLLTSTKHWQVPLIGLLGLWLAVSPWVVGLSGSGMPLAANVALGLALVAAAAAMLHPTKAALGAWLAVVLGLVTAVSPWLLGYSGQMGAVSNAVATGLASALLGLMVGLMATEPDHWWNDHVPR
jgi:SPW repeat